MADYIGQIILYMVAASIIICIVVPLLDMNETQRIALVRSRILHLSDQWFLLYLLRLLVSVSMGSNVIRRFDHIAATLSNARASAN